MHLERLVVDDLVQPPVGLVLDPHPALFLDHFTLGLERLLVDPQRGHPVRFQPERERQVLCRRGLPEDRRVFVGGRVALPADADDVGGMAFGLDVLRALEHHVLEEVREACAARLFVLGSDVIPELGVHDRRRVIFEQHDLQPVGQRGHGVVEFGRPHRGAAPWTGGDDQGQREAGTDDQPETTDRAAGARMHRNRQLSHADAANRRGRQATEPAARPMPRAAAAYRLSTVVTSASLASSSRIRVSSSASCFRISGRRRNTADDLSQSRFAIAG